MARTVRLMLSLVCVLAARTALANTCTTCYVDYQNGNDSWSGTSKTFVSGTTGPWKHAPGMLGLTPSGSSTGDGCTGNCASQTPQAGDKYILKGGVVWPYTTLPWSWSWSGSSSTNGNYGCAGNGCIYIGYDPSWNLGQVNAVTLQRDLGGCTSPPTVSFSGGGGSGAVAQANIMPGAVDSIEPNVYGFVTSVTISNPGSGYTSNPSATINGGGCTLINAVADIQRPIIDGGLNSSITWPVGYGTGSLQWGPGLYISGANYLTVDHLDIRNVLQAARACGSACNSNPDGVITAMLGNGDNGYVTYSNNYIHNRQTNCVTVACGSQEQADRAIILGAATDEAWGNYVANGESLFLGTSSNYCGSGNSANAPCEFSEHSIYGNLGGSVHNNYIYGIRWMVHLGDSGCGYGAVTIKIYSNELWLVLYDVGSAHENELYTIMSCSTLYEYNNVFHSAVSGASNQQQMGNGTTQYFFNNVSWGLGGGTSNWGIDAATGAGANGGHFYFYNNTMYGNGGTRDCTDGSGGGSSNLVIVMQNNHCITAADPYWSFSISTYVAENQDDSTTQSIVEASSTVESASTAGSEGYQISNLFAPTLASNDTVTFSSTSNSADLTSLCSGNLAALCSDINGNPRPSSGGWQAGAYYLTGVTSSAPAAPTGLTALVQ